MSRELHHGWSQAVFLCAGEPGEGASVSCNGLAGCRRVQSLPEAPGLLWGWAPLQC